MIKTDLQLLEENRDQARSMAIALEAQVELMRGKIISMIRPDQQDERSKREHEIIGVEVQVKGHNMMVEKFDRMIEEVNKHESLGRDDK